MLRQHLVQSCVCGSWHRKTHVILLEEASVLGGHGDKKQTTASQGQGEGHSNGCSQQ
jgi:hypothetical protein